MRKSEVRKWPEMDRQQKIQYLKDYYLLPAVGVILLIAVAVSLIWHVARPRTENLLYAAVIDESLDEKKLAQVTADMSNLLGADGKRKTVQIDVVILDRELFEEYAGYGYFESLDEVTEETWRKNTGNLISMQPVIKRMTRFPLRIMKPVRERWNLTGSVFPGTIGSRRCRNISKIRYLQ